MKFGLFYEVQTPKPVDSDDWAPDQEAQKFRETLDQIELAASGAIDAVIRTACIMAGTDFAVDARDLHRMGLAGMDLAQIRDTLEQGFR